LNPLIGISCDSDTTVDKRNIPYDRFVSPRAYADAIALAGGIPVLLPHTFALIDVVRLDGLLITGGNFDIPPSYYGEEPRPLLGQVNEERSYFEKALCLAALEGDIPLLGVCGGMQLLNVVVGGTLYQDLSYRPQTDIHEQPQARTLPHHEVSIAPNSKLACVCDTTGMRVNSTHHQIIHNLGMHVSAAATALDGVIEAIELPGHTFAIGVQWHPELLDSPQQHAIYRAFVKAAQPSSGE